MSKRKYKIVINNHIRAFGQTDDKTGVVEINRKKHKGDRQELANTVKHELMHVHHPKMHEKTVYKKVKGEIHTKEAAKLLKKLNNAPYSA